MIATSGQTTGASLIVMDDRIVGATNSVPSPEPLIMFAIRKDDGTVLSTMPYENDPIPPGLAKAFATAVTINGEQVPAVSRAGMSLEADPGGQSATDPGLDGPRRRPISGVSTT